MSFSNFNIENDSDGVATVTWDSPGRSMNVIDAKVMDELSAIIDQTTADAAVKGVVITSGKDAFCAGADLTMLESLSRAFAELAASQGDDALLRGKPTMVGAVPAHRDLRQALGGRHQRHGARRRFRTGAGLPSPHRCRQSAHARRPAGGQSRIDSGRRRHAADRTDDAA